MDEYFDHFLQNFGEPIERRDAPQSVIQGYKGKLPDQLLAYWQAHGWCGYAEGLFWTVNPQDYEPALEAWLGETSLVEADALHIIARSAFGHLLVWGERCGYSLKLFAPGAYAVKQECTFAGGDLDLGARAFFSIQKKAAYDFDGLFQPALRRLGRLKHDEMYGFVPALALGAPADIAHLQKVKAVEHLVLLAQLDALDIMG